jgi:hypothetical protein
MTTARDTQSARRDPGFSNYITHCNLILMIHGEGYALNTY